MFIPFGFMKSPVVAPAYDTDAQAFFTAVEGGGDTLTTTEKDAVNQLVLDLKVGNEWNQSQWIYPFVGGTASSMKWNLKNPVDTDAGYRLTFGTAMSFNSNGIIGIGSNLQTFANTHYNQSTNGDANGLVSLYLNQNMGAGGATPTNWYDFGGFDGSKEMAFIMGYNNKTTMYSQWGTGGFLVAGSGWTYVNDLFTSMDDGTTLTMYQGTTSVSSTTKGFSPINIDLTIAGSNRTTGAQETSGRGYGFAYYSNDVAGLSISNLDSSVATFTTALSRN